MIVAWSNQIFHGDCLDVMRALPDGCCSLTFTSPPYEDCRLYKPLEFKAKGQGWVDWMIPRVVEMCRVTAGLVFINAAGKVRQFKYSPVVEWLVADLTRNHGIVCGPAPYVFHRVGIPGSGGPHYHRRDWEPVYSFALPQNLPPKWSDNTAMGHPPKWAPGGDMSHRLADGSRRDQWGGTGHASSGTGRRANGEHKTNGRPSHRFAEKVAAGAKVHTKNDADGMREQAYLPPTLANPGNKIEATYTADQVAELLGHEPGDVVQCVVGGGLMGSDYAHANEAPFPESLVEFFVRSFAPEGGLPVLDPFCGSGTVPAVCDKWGRKWLAIDARESQTELTRKRISNEGHGLLANT